MNPEIIDRLPLIIDALELASDCWDMNASDCEAIGEIDEAREKAAMSAEAIELARTLRIALETT